MTPRDGHPTINDMSSPNKRGRLCKFNYRARPEGVDCKLFSVHSFTQHLSAQDARNPSSALSAAGSGLEPLAARTNLVLGPFNGPLLISPDYFLLSSCRWHLAASADEGHPPSRGRSAQRRRPRFSSGHAAEPAEHLHLGSGQRPCCSCVCWAPLLYWTPPPRLLREQFTTTSTDITCNCVRFRARQGNQRSQFNRIPHKIQMSSKI